MYIADILSDLLTQQTTRYGWIFMVTSIAFSIILLAVGLNVLSQLLFRRPYEPPVVFHWFPIIGSTISYGIDPYKFYFDCRAKVSRALLHAHLQIINIHLLVWRHFYIYSPREKSNSLSGTSR